MAEKNEELTTSSKLSNFLDKNKKAFLIVLACVVVALVAFVCYEIASSKAKVANLQKLDEISYELTNGSAALEEAELTERMNKAMDELLTYTKKSKVVGARANMLCAEIAYNQKNYEEAIKYWTAVTKKSSVAYTAPVAYFNLGSCYEQLGNLDSAVENYLEAADFKDFVLKTHAKFSLARVYEAQGKYAEAVTAYNEIIDNDPQDSWAKLSKTRILALQLEGKVE